MLFKGTVAIHSEYHTKHVSTQCRLNVELYILWQAEFMHKPVL